MTWQTGTPPWVVTSMCISPPTLHTQSIPAHTRGMASVSSAVLWEVIWEGYNSRWLTQKQFDGAGNVFFRKKSWKN